MSPKTGDFNLFETLEQGITMLQEAFGRATALHTDPAHQQALFYVCEMVEGHQQLGEKVRAVESLPGGESMKHKRLHGLLQGIEAHGKKVAEEHPAIAAAFTEAEPILGQLRRMLKI